jgi:hypothetical protein
MHVYSYSVSVLFVSLIASQFDILISHTQLSLKCQGWGGG